MKSLPLKLQLVFKILIDNYQHELLTKIYSSLSLLFKRGNIQLLGSFLFICVVLLPVKGFTQEEVVIDSLSLFTIESNYDSLIVVVDGDRSAARKLPTGKGFEIPSGNREVWIVPKYSPAYQFNYDFAGDSTYKVRANFDEILKWPSDFYLNLFYKEATSRIPPNSFSKKRVFPFKIPKASINRVATSFPEGFNSFVTFTSNVDTLYVRSTAFENFNVQKIATGDSVRVYSGNHNFIISHPKSDERTVNKVIADSSSIVINQKFLINEPSLKSLADNIATGAYYKANFIVITDNDSEIIVNGKTAGFGAARLNMPTGPARVKIINPYTGITEFYEKILNEPLEKATVLNAYTKPDLKMAHLLMAIPGMSQRYKRQKVKASAFASAFLLVGGTSYLFHRKVQNIDSEIIEVYGQYILQDDQVLATRLGDKLDLLSEDFSSASQKRNITLAVASAIFVYNIFDALRSDPYGGYRKQKNFELLFNSESSRITDTSLSLGFKYNF